MPVRMKKIVKGYIVNIVIVAILMLINIVTIKIDWQDVFLIYGVIVIILSIWEMNQNIRTTIPSSSMASFNQSEIGQE
jgi:hypothetical protein